MPLRNFQDGSGNIIILLSCNDFFLYLPPQTEQERKDLLDGVCKRLQRPQKECSSEVLRNYLWSEDINIKMRKYLKNDKYAKFIKILTLFSAWVKLKLVVITLTPFGIFLKLYLKEKHF